MAKFLPSGLISEIRNKQGGVVFSRNRGGAVVRAYQPVVHQPPSVYRDAQQAAVKALASRWLTMLTEDQRVAWERSPVGMERIDVLGVRYRLTGMNRYFAVNLLLNSLGYGFLDVPPVLNTATDPGAISITADSVSGSIILSASRGLNADEVPLIRATSARSPGQRSIDNRYRLLAFPGSALGQSTFDISEAWASRFGGLPQNARVGVRLAYVNVLTGAVSQAQAATVISDPQEVDAMLVRRIVISNARALTLFTIPLELLPAPGAGFSYFPIGISLASHHVTVPMVVAGALKVYFGNPASGIVCNVNLGQVLSAGDNVLVVGDLLYNAPAITLVSDREDQPLYLYADTADPTVGDGDYTVDLLYSLLRT